MNYPDWQVRQIAQELLKIERALETSSDIRQFEAQCGALVSHSMVLGIPWEVVLWTRDSIVESGVQIF